MPGLATYTNGFDFVKVTDAMTGRLAWRGSTPSPRSGRHWEDFHALVTEQNLQDTMPIGADLSTHQADIEKAAILRCLNGVFREREFFDNGLVFDPTDDDSEVIPNTGNFVGYEIEIPTRPDVAVQLDSVVLNFDDAATFNLYLFKAGKDSAIWQQQVTVVGGEATVVPLEDCIITYMAQDTRGSKYYIGYFQSELGSARAVRQDAHYHSFKMVEVEPFYSLATGQNFDRENIQEQAEAWGLNLQISSFKDHTAAIVAKANLFDEAVGLQHAYMVLEQLIYCVRSNATERVIKDQIDRVGLQLELNGYAPVSDMTKVEGLAQRIRKELDRLNKTFFPKPKAQTINLA